MTITETMDYIQSFQKGGRPVHDLSRIRTLLRELGDPQDTLRVVHIAGTNGKGSVLSFCAAAATAAGFHVGTLTSPFIRHYRDRIRFDGQDIPTEALCRHCERVKNCTVSLDCSQFEITFAIALLWFVEQDCDLVILETGIGGLLDATNVIQNPLVCVITSISYDHMSILGNSLTRIAAQKAGIIKPGCPVVLSPDNSVDVTCLIQETAQKKNAMLVMPSMMDCRIIEETITKTTFTYNGVSYTLHMPGRHQVYNAITAIEVIRILGMHGFLITANIVHQAFSEVRVPARTQILQKDPLVLLDGGHNQAGIAALSDLLQHTTHAPIHGVCGMMKGKDYETACCILQQTLHSVICVDDFTEEGSVSANVLMKFFPQLSSVHTAPFRQAIQTAIQQAKQDDGIVVICGSLYLASAVLGSDTNEVGL